MANTFHLVIYTPYGRYFDGQVTFLEVRSEKYNLGILPGHAPLVSTVDICKMVIKTEQDTFIYACGGGALNITKEKVTLLLDAIERADEIDLDRAKEAKIRAQKRLEEANKNDTIDVNRAKIALLKALNRINLASKD